MKATMSRMGVLAGVLLFFQAVSPAFASFTSLYCFGDGVCTTTDNTGSVPDLYHGGRFCNGRVWLEVLAEWQGLPYDPANNLSYFGHSSDALVTSTAAFTAPADAATSLVVVWSANADLIGFINRGLGYTPAAIPAWTAEIDQAVLRHAQAVTNLFNKGLRSVVMFGAADVTETPALFFFNDPPSARSFIRARAIQFNAALELAMRELATSLPGLTIYQPDVFGFFDQVITNPGDFGLVNPPGGYGAENLVVPYPPDESVRLSGPGADYVFWDEWHPSAKFQMHLAEHVRKMLTPVRIAGIEVAGGEAQLQLENIPLGREGAIESCATPTGNWLEAAVVDEPVSGGSSNKMVPAPATGPVRFFRARFPVVWTWP